MPAPDALLAALADAVGPEHVLTDPALTAGYERDWTGRFGAGARSVVRPADTAQVVEVLAACHAAGAAVVPQGGNTGLVGGGVPRDNEVVLSLRRLDTVSAPGPDATLVAGAGATVAAVHKHARRAGWAYGVDLASRDSATIGGTIATNAGGAHTVHYGPTRAQVIGVEAVLADGTVVHDLGPLLVGSEGTLAVITRARLRLVAPARDLETALVGCPDLTAAVDLTTSLRRGLPDLHAVEYMEPAGLALVGEPIPLQREHGAYLLVEAAGALHRVPGMEEAAVAADAGQRQALWHLREHHAEAIARQPGPPAHKLDVALPLTTIAAFRADLGTLGARLIVFGHLAAGNLHVNVLDGSDDLDDAILRLVAEHRGSIAAEHGIGTAKARYLPLTSTAADLDARKALKRAVDPAGILNPGVILPAR